MPVTTIKSEDQFKEVLSKPGFKGIEFVAPWEEACKAITPKWKQLAENDRWKEIEFYRVDICDQQEVAMTAGVKSAPVFQFYSGEAKVKELHTSTASELERTVGAVLAGH
ncbi:hypothetical protein BMF94_0406 [Rhodotorula taiwanensis]|uniref:Thioredoxin domain-containing protein n=1 Tax=Rhodotorula taiwanensis TaxID=741276 RepID=A0A2S5BHG8_9BASI|nr:hypothetical protein BMF94_0406 [Rhodotorula taiwanensis]